MSTTLRTPAAVFLAKLPKAEMEVDTVGMPRIAGQKSLVQAQDDDQSGGGLPPNGTFSLWQMIITLLKFASVIQKANAENQAAFAQEMGGKDGVYAKLYQVGCDVGAEDAEGIRDDAYGKFAQAGVTAGSLGVSAYKYTTSTRPAINAGEAGLDNLKPMETALNNSEAGFKLKEAPSVAPSEQTEIDNRIHGWADGSRPVSEFNVSNETDVKAVKLAANDQTKKAQIMKRINKQKTAYQNQISQADTKFNTFQQINSTATQGLNNIAAGGASIAQADAAERKGNASSAQALMQANQQAVNQMMDKAAQNAAEALRSAIQEAEAFASAASSQVRG